MSVLTTTSRWARHGLMAAAIVATGALTLGATANQANAQVYTYPYYSGYYPAYPYYSYYRPYYPYYGYPYVHVGWGWGWGRGWHGGWGHGGWGHGGHGGHHH
jgi:hypothetical protein